MLLEQQAVSRADKINGNRHLGLVAIPFDQIYNIQPVLACAAGQLKIALRCSFIVMVLRKDQIEASLLEEHQLILSGKLKEDNPLDLSESFSKLCECCRRGDTKGCQELITEGTNINARDGYDYTPLILVGQSLRKWVIFNH